MSIKSVCVVGLGYIGLPTAALFASRGLKVLGLDINQDIVDSINKGEVHIKEAGLPPLVKNVVSNGSLIASTNPAPADAFVIAVPTPLVRNQSEKIEADLTYIEAAIEQISSYIVKGNLIVLESTSPVGTTARMTEKLTFLRPDLNFASGCSSELDVNIAYCPERMIPGRALEELVNNSKIIGGITAKCSEAAAKLYSNFVEGELLQTSAGTAELVKLTENASRDVEIAFANELSLVCDKLNLNVWEVIELSNKHPRVNILQPGPGVGGHCIAIDPWFIVGAAPEETPLMQTARKVNDSKPLWVVEKIKSAICEFSSSYPEKNHGKPKIAFFGATFKPNVDDLRESPAMIIINKIRELYPENLMIVEPNIKNQYLSGIPIVDIELAYETADVSVLLVDHKEFTERGKPTSIIVDTKGTWIS